MEPFPKFFTNIPSQLTFREKLCLGFLLVLVAISFSPILQNSFVEWDDYDYIVQNPKIRDLSLVNLVTIFTSYHSGNYHPLTSLSNALEYSFLGSDPFFFHLNNLVLHLLNVGLVFFFCRRLSGSLAVSLLAAGFFGIHPLKVESVAWASERKDLLYAFFFLLSLLAYDFFLQTNRRLYKGASLVLFAASLLSKGQGVMLPLILFFLDAFRGRAFGKESVLEKTPFFILAGVFVLIAIHAQAKAEAIIHGFPWYSPVFLASFGIVFYVSKILLPINLCHMYPYSNELVQLGSPIYLAAPLVLMGLVMSVKLLSKEFSFAVFGGAFSILAVFPVLQIIPYAAVFAADRYTYLAIIGPALILAEGFQKLRLFLEGRGKWMTGVLFFFLMGFFLALSLVTLNRCRVWANTLTLWTDMIEKYPNHKRGYLNRAGYYLGIGNFARAREDLEKAREIDGNDAAVTSLWGVYYLRQGKVQEAIRELERARQAAPELLDPKFNLGLAYLMTNEPEKSLEEFSAVIHRRPGNWEALGNRAVAFAKLKRWPEAQKDIDLALTIFPKKPELEKIRKTIFTEVNGSLEK